MKGYPQRIVRVLVFLIVCVGLLKLLVWWLEPRMAFFPTSGVQETPLVFKLPSTDHKIPTADGETLHAWWMQHSSPRAQVIYWHGNGGNLSLWLPVIADLHQRGFSVLAVDYRGYGGSTGRPSERGLYRDGEAAVVYFRERLQQRNVPVIYWGRSLGCTVASYTAASTAPDGLVLESPFPDTAFLFRDNPIMRVLSLFSTYRFATRKHLEPYAGPLLVVHGDADSVIPFEAGKQVYDDAATERKTFAVLKGADHNDVYARHPDYATILDRFVSALR